MAKSTELNMAKFLSTWYIMRTTFADVAREVDGDTAEVDYAVKYYHCHPAVRPNLRGSITTEGDVTKNTFVIDGLQPPHTIGHLRDMPIFQAHLADGALIETATNNRGGLWLVRFRTITHSEPGIPGDTLIATTTLLREESGARLVRGAVHCANRVHTRAFDMRFEDGPTLPDDGFYLPQHALFEIGAQASGAAVKLLRPDLLEGERVPIFDSIGPSTLEAVVLRPGDNLTTLVRLRRVTNQGVFYTDTLVRQQGRPIAAFGNLGIGFLPRELIKAKIRELQHD